MFVFQALDKRNQLRQKLGQNKIAPQAQTDLEIKAEQIVSTRKESPTSWDIFTVEEKKHEEVAVDTSKMAESKSEENVGDNVSTGGIEKVGGDAALCELIFFPIYSHPYTPVCGYLKIGVLGGDKSTTSIHWFISDR